MKNFIGLLTGLFLASSLSFATYLGDPTTIKGGGTGLSTIPSSANILIGTGTAYGLHPLSSEATMSSAGAVTLTNSAVIGKVLTGYSSGAGTVSATDTILQAIQKLNGNAAAISGAAVTSLTGEATGTGPGATAVTLTNSAVIGKVLTGYTIGAGTVSATDTILQAFQKVDGNTGVNSTAISTLNARNINTTAPLAGGGNLSADRTLTCNVASGSQPGCLASADFTTFNNKGDFSSNTSSSVDSEVVLFSGTAGKTGKRATGTGFAKLTSGVLSVQASPIPKADIGGGRTVNTQSGTTYTFVIGDGQAAGGNTLVVTTSGSATTVTVPPNSSVAFPVGDQIDIAQHGAGKLTLAQGAGVTINSFGGNKAAAGQYVGLTLVKTATDTWTLYGNLIP